MTDIDIVITDDDALIVSLLEAYLQNCAGMNVLFTAYNGSELFSQLIASPVKPHIILLDLRMDGMDGVEITTHLKNIHPEIKIIVITSHYQKAFMGFMLKTGVSAFLPKGISPAHLVDVIKTVYKQGYYFEGDQMDVLREQITSKSPKPMLDEGEVLSEREVAVLKLICQQKTAKEIGELLFITQRTAEGHKNNLFAKTGAKNIAGLVIYAIQHNIIKVEDLPVI
jgi:DNA-binding NarL/FixJ family response regulator